MNESQTLIKNLLSRKETLLEIQEVVIKERDKVENRLIDIDSEIAAINTLLEVKRRIFDKKD